MDNYPSNSNSVKSTTQPPAEKKIESVVTGGVTRRKTPLGKRLAETFIGGDAKTVGGYVVFEVLIPAARDMLANAFTQGVERMIYGDGAPAGRRIGARPSGSNGYTAYNRITSANGTMRQQREQFSEMSRRARANHDFDEIILETRFEAEEVIRKMHDILDAYEVVTVSDLYELVGTTPNYTDEKWGWTDLQGSGVTPLGRGGYLLDLPRTVSIK